MILTVLESVSEDFESKNGISAKDFFISDSGWGLSDEGLDLPDALTEGKRSSLSLLILILLESISEDFESKNGIRGSELTVIG